MKSSTPVVRVIRFFALLILAAVLALQVGSLFAREIPYETGDTGTTTRVSVASAGTQGNGDSLFVPSLSANGRYVAFSSSASNLVAGDSNGAHDIFVHDRETGQTSRVSVDSAGAQGNGSSVEPALSADGRYVAFRSDASNLVAGDSNGAQDVFVHDRQTGQTTRVSVDSAGAQGNGSSGEPAITADGRYVAFYSWASNLVAGDNNGDYDIFVHDRQTGQTSRVSVDSAGAQGNGDSYEPAITADGRYVAFGSSASDLVAGDSNSSWDIFVHDRETGQTTRVSVDSAGAQANGSSGEPALSADARYVAFYSWASNLVAGDSNGYRDVFVHDRGTGQTSRVSVDSAGAQANGSSGEPAITADGRYVAFYSWASNLVAGDNNGDYDIFVHDRQTGQTSRVSVDSAGAQGNGDSYEPAITADGRYVAFYSSASNLVAGDSNGVRDTFVHDRGGIPEGNSACEGANPSIQPLMLVHGWGAPDYLDGDTMGFAAVKEYLKQRGWIEDCNLFYARGLVVDSVDFRERNRQSMSDNMFQAYYTVRDWNPGWNGHFDIIGHSYGGLNARFYLESDYYRTDRDVFGIQVDNLFTLGSPHGGTNTLLELYPAAAAIGLPHLASNDWPSAAYLTDVAMASYNLGSRQPGGTCYRLVGGDFLRQPDIAVKAPTFFGLYSANPTWALPNDIGVSQRSSLDLGSSLVLQLSGRYPHVVTHPNYDMHGYVDYWWLGLEDVESYFRSSEGFSESFDRYVTPVASQPAASTSANLQRCDQDSVVTNTETLLSETVLADTNNDSVPPVLVAADIISGGQTLNYAHAIDWIGSTAFYVTAARSDVLLTLQDPNGRAITPESSVLDVNVSYDALFMNDTFLATYIVVDAVAGVWQIALHNADSAEASFEIYAVPPVDADLVLSSSAPSQSTANAPILISAELTNAGTPELGASVVASVYRPDGSVVSLPLADDGQTPDAAASDGIYSGTLTDTEISGNYRAVVAATGTVSGLEFERSVNQSFVVVPASVELNGISADNAVDGDNNGLFEQLGIDISVAATEERQVRLSAALYSSSDTLVDVASKVTNVTTGTQTITLPFSGDAIRAAGIDGPYNVKDLTLSDDGLFAALDEWTTPYATGAYQHEAFGVPLPPDVPTVVSPLNGAAGVDPSVILRWAAGDRNPYDTLTYEISFGDTSPPPQAITSQSESSFDPPGDLNYGTTYYWQIVVDDGHGGVTASPVWSFMTISRADVGFQAGWNMVSLYLAPDDPSMDAIFPLPQRDDLVLCKHDNEVYWPAFDINTIGDWDPAVGYQCYTTQAFTLTVTGRTIDPLTPIDLPAGWNMIAYWQDTPIPVDQALSSLGINLVIAKTGDGKIYWPEYGINSIGDMQPGQGYKLYVSAPATLIYPTD